MNLAAREQLRQRADYTHKFNVNSGRHGWLRLTPAYSVKIVTELIDRHDGPVRLLDPFCGTATTVLCGAYRGHEGVTTDINPFLVWLGQTKTAKYTCSSIQSTRRASDRVLRALKRRASGPVTPPPMHNISRWWSAEALEFLCRLRKAIELESSKNSAERNLMLVAFCRTLIQLSSAAFNHQSMSFKNESQVRIPLDMDMAPLFIENVRFVLKGAEENPSGTATVLPGDARSLPDAIDGHFDLIITSPPYANRMSYIRELRPYMYWLGFLDSGRAAGELDWLAIGGTWGSATSRLAHWKRSEEPFHHPLLESALTRIAHDNHKNGKVLASYVAKYVDDMWVHFCSLVKLLDAESELHYIVGNSVFYGVLLPVEQLYAAMLERLGFRDIECRPIRKRNSKKELFEFDVSAHWASGTKPSRLQASGGNLTSREAGSELLLGAQ